MLVCAEGMTHANVARRTGVLQSTVGKWRRRFLVHGIQGLHDERRPGRPRTYEDEKEVQLIHRALQSKPEHGLLGSTQRAAVGPRAASCA